MAYEVNFSLGSFVPAIDFADTIRVLCNKTSNPLPVYQFDVADVPTEAVLSSNHKTIPDFVPISGMLSVCPEMRALIEELEPEVHELFPVQIKPKNLKKVLLRRDGQSLTEPYYLLNIQTAIDAVCIEQSKIKSTTIAPGITFVTKEGKVVLYKNMIAGHHVWRGYRQLPTYKFFSNILVQKINGERRNGLNLTYFDEV